jgi:hypothetical protein
MALFSHPQKQRTQFFYDDTVSNFDISHSTKRVCTISASIAIIVSHSATTNHF